MRPELDELLPAAADDLTHFRNTHIYITGGTGYVGKNLLESIVWANSRLGTKIRATILSRDPQAIRQSESALVDRPEFTLVAGDVRTFSSIDQRFDAVIHAATPASAALNIEQPLEMLDTIIDGGRNTLAIASKSGAIPFLFTSSGAVYGPQASTLSHQPEDTLQGPDQLSIRSAYAEGKRVAELQCALHSGVTGLHVKIARIYAQIGPHLPLDRHFAAGNFLGNAIAGAPITLHGDGSTIRSYLYATEMTVWLWAILARGTDLRAYNVGSEEAVSTKELADRIAGAVSPQPDVRVLGKPDGTPIDRYVPSTARIRGELGVEQRIKLHEAIERSLKFIAQSGTGRTRA